jgi:hypothetical protein
MFWFILLFVICLIFLPFPIFIKIIYANKELKLFLYKKRIQKNKNKRKINNNIKWSIRNLNNILSKMKNVRIKPILKLKLILKYGMEDAATTGLSYGALNLLFPFTFQLIKMIFNVSKFEYDIHPDFNKIILDLEVKSIIFINLFTISFMYFFVIKEIKYANNKENILREE